MNQIFIADNGTLQKGFEDANDCTNYCKKKPGYRFKVVRFKPKKKTTLLKNALVKDKRERDTLLKLIYELCWDCQIEADTFLTNFTTRNIDFVMIRSVVMLYSQQSFDFSAAEAGFIFNKTSATAHSAIKSLNNRLETDVKFKTYITEKLKIINEYYRNYNNTELHTES